jgi:hypothetical protein
MANDNRSRLLATHWNASVYGQAEMPQLIDELVLHALMYDDVLVQAEDVATNPAITDRLSDESALDTFTELLRSGCVKLVTPSPADYPADLRNDPATSPIAARAELHSRERSFKGDKWEPTAQQRRLYAQIDTAILDAQSRALVDTRPYAPENRFAAQLMTLLSERRDTPLFSRPPLNDISDELAEAFISFCDDPREAATFLDAHGITPLAPDRFYRTTAYQCFRLFPQYSGMLRLVESVYAACSCEREQAEGRYDGTRLMLMPRPLKEPHGHEDDRLARVTPSLIRSRLPVLTQPMVGGVVAYVRESTEFQNLQRCLRDMRRGMGQARALADGWDAVCDKYGTEFAGRSIVPASAGERLGWTVAAIGLLGGLAAAFQVQLPPYAMPGFAATVQYLGPKLSEALRVGWEAEKTAASLHLTLDVACTQVSLLPPRP